MTTPLIITLIVIVVLALIAVFIYNSLIVKRNRVDEAWSDINVQLKRRYDLIPNLVETVKGYAKHERELFEKVTQARSAAMGAGTMAEKAQAENMLSQTLKSLFAVSENYPDLKASQNFLQLQDELSDTENKIKRLADSITAMCLNSIIPSSNSRPMFLPEHSISQNGTFSNWKAKRKSKYRKRPFNLNHKT